ncbi:hypothetical protein PR048_007585 [Dryococelus australis]|uniref:Uncharacterized protein n=1 Tax=Dryococelus australis TaxID=614101 RepID=A0ABQ9HWB2_9NEOP|nr:hypothetical protein PR048_007585 [Dryococelus australis]
MCVANSKHAFVNARKRKQRYVTFLKDKCPEDEKKHTLFPLPVMSKWTSSYTSAKYADEHVEDLLEFLSAEDGSNAVVYFKRLSQDDVAVTKCSSVFALKQGSLGEDTCTSIAKMSTQVKQHSLCEDLVSVGLKCVTKLSDLMNRDAGKEFILHICKLFHPSNVSNNLVDEKLYNLSAKNTYSLPTVPDKSFGRLLRLPESDFTTIG